MGLDIYDTETIETIYHCISADEERLKSPAKNFAASIKKKLCQITVFKQLTVKQFKNCKFCKKTLREMDEIDFFCSF